MTVTPKGWYALTIALVCLAGLLSMVYGQSVGAFGESEGIYRG